MKNSRQRIAGALVVGLLILLSACSKNPSGPETAPTNRHAEIASEQGTAVFRSIQTLEELDRSLEGPAAYGKIELPAVGSLAGQSALLSANLQHLQRAVKSARVNPLKTNQTSSDSLIYEDWWTDPLTGTQYHTTVRYDFTSGLATVTVVAQNFPAGEVIERDSTEILVQTNFTLEDTTDDVIRRLENRKDYRADYRLQYEQGTLVPDDYEPGTEPEGGVVDAKKVFNAGQDTSEATYHLEYHAGDRGSFAEQLRFEDGSSSSASVVFGDQRISINAKYRDDSTEQTEIVFQDEHDLSFTKRLVFAPGSDPVSLVESGRLIMNPADSSASVSLTRETTNADGTIDRCELSVAESRTNGFRRVEVTASSSDGTSMSWTLQEGAEKNRVEGTAIDQELRYSVFNADYYHDGRVHLHLEVYASKEAFDRGEAPIFVADIFYRPDGSGSGTITSNEGIQNFKFGSDGNPS